MSQAGREFFVFLECALYLAVFARADCVLRRYSTAAIDIEEVGEVVTKSSLINTSFACQHHRFTRRRNLEDTATDRGLICCLIVGIPLLVYTIEGDNIPFTLCQLTNTLSRGAIAVEVGITIRLAHHRKALGVNSKRIHPFDFYICLIGVS